MPKFLYVYHGGATPDSLEEAEQVMVKWGKWLASLGSDVVDGGHPVGPSKTVSASGVADDGGPNPASGYGLFSASDMSDAVEKAKTCPVIEAGGSVEVAQAMEV